MQHAIHHDPFASLRAEFHARLDDLQFGTRGPDSKFLVIPQDGYGFGAQLSRRTLGLKLGYLSSRTVIFQSEDYGPYLQCFESTGNVAFEDINDHATETLQLGVEQKCRAVVFDFDDLWADLNRFWEVHDFTPESFRRLGLDHRVLEGMILQRLKPLEWYAIQIKSIQERIGFDNPIIGVHIRRGDKHVENPYVPIRKYKAEICDAVAHTGISRVFVTSDDPGVFALLPDPGRIEYIYDKEEPRYNNANHQLVSQQPNLKRQETLTALKIYELLRQCDYIIGQDNAHLTLLAANRNMADHCGEENFRLIPGDYSQVFRKAALADWGDVLAFKAGSFCRKHKIPGVRSGIRAIQTRIGRMWAKS
jgi:hypothetical protein